MKPVSRCAGMVRLLVAPVSWVLSIHAVQAQPTAAPAPEARLGEITITGNPLGAADRITPASQMDSAELLLRRQSSLGETLDGLPGVSSSYFGPASSRPIIRGMDGDRVRVLTNSGAANDVSGLSFDHAVPVDPLTVERVEVLRGPAVLQYGGGAMGGVVNVLNNRVPDEPLFDAAGGVSGRTELRAGGAERERAGSLLLEAGTDRYAVHVDAFERQAGSVAVPKALACDPSGQGLQLRNEHHICNSQSAARGAAAGVSWFHDRGTLGLGLEDYRSNYGSVAEDTVNIGMRQTRATLKGEQRGLGGWFSALKGQWSHTGYQHTEFDGAQAGTEFRSSGNELRLEARQRSAALAGGKLDGVLGLQVEGARFSATGDEAFVPNTRTTSRALFAVQEWRAPRGKLSAGARLEDVRVASTGQALVDRFAVGERRFSPASFSFGGLWNIGAATSGWSASANLARTQRAPRDYELFANGRHVATGAWEQGNAALGLEQSAGVDAGIAWKRGPERLALNLFAQRFTHFISLERTGASMDMDGQALPLMQYRDVTARFVGLDAQGAWRLLNPGPSGTLDLEARADWLRATNTDTGAPLPRVAPLRLGGMLKWALGPWSARLGFDHHTAQNRVAPGDVAVAGYTLWNAALTWTQKLGPSTLQWFVRGDNLGNRLAYSASSILTQTAPGRVPLPGRSVRVGLQVLF